MKILGFVCALCVACVAESFDYASALADCHNSDISKCAGVFVRICEADFEDLKADFLASNEIREAIERDIEDSNETTEQYIKALQMASCSGAAETYIGGYGGDEGKEKAVWLFMKNCDEKCDTDSCKQAQSYACYALGRLYMSGVGVEMDAQKAREFFLKACALDERSDDCMDLDENLGD